MTKLQESDKQVEEIVDRYKISHKGDAQCKCIEGARGHLLVRLEALIKTETDKAYNKGIIDGSYINRKKN